LQQMKRSAANQAEIGLRVVFSGAMGILPELHIQYPVLLILDGPVMANRQRDARDVDHRTKIVAPLVTDFAANVTCRLHHCHCLQSRPFSLLREPIEFGTRHRAPGLDATAILFHGFMNPHIALCVIVLQS